MCKPQNSIVVWNQASVALPEITPPEGLRTGSSRRRRLWELPQMCHCPVIGVCLSLETLRGIVQKHFPGRDFRDDYDVHVTAVGQSDRRSRLTEQIQAELERRSQIMVRQYRALGDEQALEQAWLQAVRNGEAAAALWAVLTHPRAGMVLIERVIHTMHMVQHQAGAAMRVDLAAHRALQASHQALHDALNAETERHGRQLAERDRRIEQGDQELARLRTELAGRDSLILALKTTLADLHAVMPDVAGIRRLRTELDELRAYSRALERRLRKTGQITSPAETAALEAVESAAAPLAEDVQDLLAPGELGRHLENRKVLCVGGRTRTVVEVRSLIEGAGGAFVFHDGGFENSLHQLDSTLAAADLVICQTGCISHNAYWRVKTHCKRTGKRCVFVEAPGRAGLLKHIGELAETVSPVLADDVSDM